MAIRFVEVESEGDVPDNLTEREAAWIYAMQRKNYRAAALLARAPLPHGTTKNERRKWNMQKFIVRDVPEDEESPTPEDIATPPRSRRP